MKYSTLEYFQRFGEQSLLHLEEVRKAGRKVAGIYCTFAPAELIWAAGAVPVGLCGKKEAPIAEAEKTLPVNLCPLIKSSYGYAVTDTCPFFAASDFLIGETTCDGKKKMFELLGRIKPLFLLQLPYNADGPMAALLWQEEIYRLKEYLKETTGNRIDREGLRYQIRINNQIRKLLKEIVYQCAGETVPITGLDLLLIEESGGIVVCQENCTGLKSFDRLIDETDKDPYLAIGRYYLQTPCSCLTPNTGRFDLIARLIKDFNIQGVVDLTWRCCLTYSVEAHLLQEFLEKNGPIPFLHLETDYSSWDVEQLKTRVEAFLEVVRA